MSASGQKDRRLPPRQSWVGVSSSVFGCSVSPPPPLSPSLPPLPHSTSLSGTFGSVSSSSLSLSLEPSTVGPFMPSDVRPESRALERSLTAGSRPEKPRAESSEGLIAAGQCRSGGVAGRSGPPEREGRQSRTWTCCGDLATVPPWGAAFREPRHSRRSGRRPLGMDGVCSGRLRPDPAFAHSGIRDWTFSEQPEAGRRLEPGPARGQ